MPVAGVINTLVMADTSPFEKGMDKAGAAAGRLRAVTQQQSAGITSAFSAMGNLSGTGGFFGGIAEKAAGVFGMVKTIIGGFASQTAAIVGPGSGIGTAIEREFARGGAAAAGFRSTVASSAASANASIANMGTSAAPTVGIFGRLAGLLANPIGLAVGAFVAGAAAAVGFGLALHTMASHGAEAMMEINKLSKVVGVSVEELSRLSTLGGGSDTFAHFITHMQRAIEEGGAKVGEAFAKMGLELGQVQRMSEIGQIEAVFGAWQKLATQGERVSAVRTLGGRGGIDMLEQLSRGAAGLELARQKARDFGLEFTQEQADTIRRSNIAWAGFGQAMKGIGIQAAGMFAPLWESVGKVGGEIGKTLVSAFKTAMPFLSAVGGLIGDIFSTLANASFIGSIIAVFKDAGGSIGDAFKAVMPWLTIIVQTISAMVRVVGDVAGAIWSGIWTAIKGVGDIIISTFAGGVITAWFASFNVGWAGIKTAALGAMASIVVVAKNWKDAFGAAIDFIHMKFLEMKKGLGFGSDEDDATIARLQRGLTAVNTSLGAQVRTQIETWERALAGIGAQVGGVAQNAPGGAQTEQRAITGHDAALQNSERAYSILNSQQPTMEQLQRSQIEINRRIQVAVEAQLALDRRNPRIRGIRR